MIWFIREPGRYEAEFRAVEALQQEVSWLEVEGWSIHQGHLQCEAEIMIPPRTYPVTLRYNEGYPDVPPSVIPRVKERWSAHQYGTGGELCLEHGPDNWISTLTGADMLRSAHRLLESEAAAPDTPAIPAPSRHELTRGQALRSQIMRFIRTPALMAHWDAFGVCTPGQFAMRLHGQSWVWYALSWEQDGQMHLNPDVPTAGEEHTYTRSGFFIRHRGEVIDTSLPSAFRGAFPEVWPDPAVAEDTTVILLGAGHEARMFYLYQDKVLECGALIEPDPAQRLPESYGVLASKRVGVVGCGSLGSKVAAMLARAGARDFVLVDDDTLRPENLVRHDLDWSGVGEGKAHALAQRLSLIRPGTKTQVRTHRLGGQESSSGAAAVVRLLSQCDLLIDATASATAFRYVAAAARGEGRPVFWAEVFAGGLGGLICRSRPGLDPAPDLARARVLHWCELQDAEPPERSKTPYGLDGERPEIADDADVSVIAAHLARIAIDHVVAPQISQFPYSAYAVGLKAGWVFSQPFDTVPIDLGAPEETAPDSKELEEAGVSRLLALLQEPEDAQAESGT